MQKTKGRADALYSEISGEEDAALYLEEQGIAVKDDCIFYMYLPEREAFRLRVKYEFRLSPSLCLTTTICSP